MLVTSNSPLINTSGRPDSPMRASTMAFNDDGCNRSLTGETPEITPAGTGENSAAKKKAIQKLIAHGVHLPGDGPIQLGPMSKKQVAEMNKGLNSKPDPEVGPINVSEIFNAELDRRFGKDKGGFRYDEFGHKIFKLELKDGSGKVVGTVWDHDHNDPDFS